MHPKAPLWTLFYRTLPCLPNPVSNLFFVVVSKFSDYIYKRPKVRTYLPIEGDRSHKQVLMQNRIVRSPDFQEYNQERQFVVNKEHKVKLNYENFDY